MKIEYLEGDRPPRPLVRLFDFQAREVNALREACNGLADGTLTEFLLHEQPWAESVNQCQFVWRISQKDIGVRLRSPGQPLVLEYSDEAWREVERKLSQFVEPRPNTFNWLTMEGEVDVLISPDGKW